MQCVETYPDLYHRKIHEIRKLSDGGFNILTGNGELDPHYGAELTISGSPGNWEVTDQTAWER